MPRWKGSGLLTLRLFYYAIVGSPGALWASRRLNNNPILGTRSFVEYIILVVMKDRQLCMNSVDYGLSKAKVIEYPETRRSKAYPYRSRST